MCEQQGHTTIIQQMLIRLENGDESAREDLIKHSMERLHKLTRKMLGKNQAVRRWNETDDVFQDALIRLNRALQTERPDSVRRFISLAATQIRRELIDLWRHHYGPQGDGTHHDSDRGQDFVKVKYAQDPNDTAPNEIACEDMERFHSAVGKLSDDLREVFEKSYYLDMTQVEIAKDVGVSTKTIKRRWRDSKLELEELLKLDSD